jgi:hypothetical protein
MVGEADEAVVGFIRQVEEQTPELTMTDNAERLNESTG